MLWMRYIAISLIAVLLVAALWAQQPAQPPPPAAQPAAGQPPAAQPAAQPPAAQPPAQPPAAQPQTQPANPPRLADNGGFLIPNASLAEMIDILAKRLKINYILDPRVKGTVTIYTYGEVKPVDEMQILQTILRVNGATMVRVGDLYRIVPTAAAAQLPVDPISDTDTKTIPDDERMMLNLIFLKYATATEVDKLIAPFLGEGGKSTVYEPANLLIIQDNARSMRRTLELVSLFDSDTFAGQRVQLYSIENSRPTDLVKDLDNVFKAYALSDKNGAVKFIPIDRINTVIAVAPNPGIFPKVEDWIKKLDVPVKLAAGGLTNYVYRMKYGRAETVAMAIMALYTGNIGALVSMAQAANANMVGMGMGYTGAFSGGGGAPGYGGFGGGYGSNPYGQGYGQGYGASPYGAYPGAAGPAATPFSMTPNLAQSGGAAVGAPAGVAGAPGTNLTGSYLGYSSLANAALAPGMPHIVPNPFDNTLIIQATPEEYSQITNLLRQIDVPPRQVLIDAKIYEVDLTHDLNGSVASCLQSPGTCATALAGTGSGASGSTGSSGSGLGINPSAALNAIGGPAGLALTAGALISKNKQLMGVLNALESVSKSRVISAPSIIATDSIPATMNVGTSVPVATSTAPTGVQTGGNTIFAENISQQSTGITLSITAHVNSSGIVTMIINQQVSAPQANSFSALNSPSFSNRSVSTQVTVQDGDTVAIGGAIQEQWTESTGGIPILNRIPILGTLFGSQSYSKARTELIVFLTPRVIYDTDQIVDASDELKQNLKNVTKMMVKEQ
jgi:general secretion pathway protein D